MLNYLHGKINGITGGSAGFYAFSLLMYNQAADVYASAS